MVSMEQVATLFGTIDRSISPKMDCCLMSSSCAHSDSLLSDVGGAGRRLHSSARWADIAFLWVSHASLLHISSTAPTAKTAATPEEGTRSRSHKIFGK